MDDFYNPSMLLQLHKLLNPPNSDSEDEPDDRVPSVAVSSKPANRAPHTTDEKSTPSNGEPTTIDEWEEQEAKRIAVELDHRIPPEYNIVYKQTVSPEDIYLPLSTKTPATKCCEEICLEIHLTNETVGIDQMELDICETGVDLQTPIYHLSVPFPKRIDPDQGKAEWHHDKKLLTLTLRTKQTWNCVRNNGRRSNKSAFFFLLGAKAHLSRRIVAKHESNIELFHIFFFCYGIRLRRSPTSSSVIQRFFSMCQTVARVCDDVTHSSDTFQ